MDITEVRISLADKGKLKAFVSITFDDCFVVRGIKIIRGTSGFFVAMPSRKIPDGEFQDIAHPINSQTRQWMEELILGKYKELMSGSGEDDSESASEAGPAGG